MVCTDYWKCCDLDLSLGRSWAHCWCATEPLLLFFILTRSSMSTSQHGKVIRIPVRSAFTPCQLQLDLTFELLAAQLPHMSRYTCLYTCKAAGHQSTILHSNSIRAFQVCPFKFLLFIADIFLVGLKLRLITCRCWLQEFLMHPKKESAVPG